jgi:hypothetical protein
LQPKNLKKHPLKRCYKRQQMIVLAGWRVAAAKFNSFGPRGSGIFCPRKTHASGRIRIVARRLMRRIKRSDALGAGAVAGSPFGGGCASSPWRDADIGTRPVGPCGGSDVAHGGQQSSLHGVPDCSPKRGSTGHGRGGFSAGGFGPPPSKLDPPNLPLVAAGHQFRSSSSPHLGLPSLFPRTTRRLAEDL